MYVCFVSCYIVDIVYKPKSLLVESYFWFNLFAILHLQFAYVKPTLFSYNGTNLIMAYDPFNVMLNSVCKYFIEIFLSKIIKGTLL
jgi:hypothetical protein